MIRQQFNSRSSKKRKLEQLNKSRKKMKMKKNKKFENSSEIETRNSVSLKKFNSSLIQEKENWKNVQDESSEDDEELEDPLKVLLKTFGHNESLKTSVLSDSDSENEDNSNNKEDHSGSEQDSQTEDLKIGKNFEDNLKIESHLIDENLGIKKNSEIQEDSENEIENNKRSSDAENQESDENNENTKAEIHDPFLRHLKNDIDDDLSQSLSTIPKFETYYLNWPILGNIVCQIPISNITDKKSTIENKSSLLLEDKIQYAEPGTPPILISSIDWKTLHVKPQIHMNVSKSNYKNIKDTLETDKNPLTPLQRELFSLINNYQDLFFPQRTFANAEQIRLVYCLHTMNHILKTREKILKHNLKLSKSHCREIPDEFRDQGLVRPKVLIIVPFRDSCLKIINILISLLLKEEKGGSVMNKNRFMEEFTGGEIQMPRKKPKPEDYELTFTGNSDDNFRIGIKVTKRVLKLYSDFYSSDIIIASPLGLRTLIGAEGDPDRDYDYLASIEVMILDQTEIFIMQNWDHFIHIMNHLHLQPKIQRGTDFSRIRSWAVNGLTKYYRQTIIFSAFETPEIHGIFSKRCQNYAGKNIISNLISPASVSQVIVKIPQIYHRFEATSYSQAIDARFNYFVSKILPQYTDSIMDHTMIFVPSYFDFVKIRNYLRSEHRSFVQICEYTKDGKIAKARDIFFHGEAHFLLYTERFHFFRRIRVKGIRHIIFYGPPLFSHFYSEICNFMQENNQNPKGGSENNMSITVLYCKFDALQLKSLVGTEKTTKMLNTTKNIYMIITDD